MLTSVSPTMDQCNGLPLSPGSADPPQRSENSNGTGGTGYNDDQSNWNTETALPRSHKPPPLHTGADWKVVLHLPEIEKWLRATSGRVTQLMHSVGQDGQHRHVDAHLVQLKDICEDISDHVEQIHALLETEFSLKLLSYSVNIIVDIRTVQLLWHQLRVSVLVLKERLLQSLQDSNGNFTRQTDILQAFSGEQHQTRLDALTEVDDCGQLTIRCSQDYFSLDCGITAFELSDYSPGEEPENCNTKDPTQETEHEESHLSDPPTIHFNQNENIKRPLQGESRSTDVSPTQPSFPKRAAVLSGLQLSGKTQQSELSRSVPTLVDLPEQSRFWLDLDSVYPEQVSQSCESLQVMNGRNQQRNQGSSRHKWSTQRSNHTGSPGAAPTTNDPGDETTKRPKRRPITAHSEEDSDSPRSSPIMDRPFSSSDMDASGEESDPRPSTDGTSIWIVKRPEQKEVSDRSKPSTDREHWYGSEEFLALPSQLQKTETLAMKLESLTQSISQGRRSSTQDALQDVDDWDLTELNQDWEPGANVSSDEFSSPPPPLFTHRQISAGRFSPASSSDIAPSLDESIESGPLSDLQSEDDEGQRSADPSMQRMTTPMDESGCTSLVEKLLEQIQSQDGDSQIWNKIECFVKQLDSFILWLQEALQSTENWTQPRQDVDSLRTYLDTHLSFKLNVESRSALKENIVQEGKELLASIGSQHSGLKEILLLVSSQWDQLQRQIRRQHAWMLRALRCIQARLLYTSQPHQYFKPQGEPSANQQPENLKEELFSGQCEAQRAALEQMAIKLNSLHYPSPKSRRRCTQLHRNNSVQEYEAEYQELYDWLMDMDAMVTDSHQLMMSEEQRRQLFKSSHVELMMMEARKSVLLGRAESLKRSGTELPGNFNSRIHNLTHTWEQLERILSEQSGLGTSQQKQQLCEESPRSALSPLTNSLLEQLEARIKELKSWLRDTELLIFNSCLRRDKDAGQQLAIFKSLCSEIRARRRGVASVLKLCQKLLQQSQCGPTAEQGPDAEQHREALQLLSINLERRWEAIVMQALQWQNRLKRQLGEQEVPGNFLEVGLTDLHQMSLVSTGLPAPAPEDSWEWDETDMTIADTEPDLTHNLPTKSVQEPTETLPTEAQDSLSIHPNNNSIFQVYSLHHVELYCQPQFPAPSSTLHKLGRQKPLLKSQDSSFSSTESLPDLLGGLTSKNRRTNKNGTLEWEHEGRRGSQMSGTGRRSESESGIVSDMGDTETTTTTSENPGEEEEECSPYIDATKGWKIQELVTSEKSTSCRRPRAKALEFPINGQGILTPPDSESDPETCTLHEGLQNHSSRALGTVVSPGSSLESLLALGVELFPTKDTLHRSASLESCVIHNAELGDSTEVSDVNQRRGSDTGEPSAGELSRRTLDLLKRLENIQSPLEGQMTRSVSDMMLRSGSLQRNRLRPSPSLSGYRTGRSDMFRPSSLMNPATTSLTELSSAEDTSQGSDDFRNKDQLLATNSNSGFYKRRCLGNRLGQGMEEGDVASLSMVVNISACTDDDEDDSDLLSSSTLTLTGEEYGVRDEDDREDELLDGASPESEEDDREEDMDGSYLLGFDYMNKELQSCIPFPRSSSSSKTEMSLRDELKCGTHPPSTLNKKQPCFPSRQAGKFLDMNSCENTKQTLEESKRNSTRSYVIQLADDVENGNVDLRAEDHDDQLLREEASVLYKNGATAPHAYTMLWGVSNQRAQTQAHSSSLVGQLKGELPCQSSAPPSPPSLSPVDDLIENDSTRRKAITIEEKCKFSSFVTEETRKEVRDKDSALPPRKWHRSHSSCCSHPPSTSPPQTKENVHNFVKEIIDMTSLALRSKDTEAQEVRSGEPIMEQTPASQIRDKVLEHSHRPLHIRKVDFYSYLSLSSHDSDCGEVSQCTEDKSSTPAPDATSTPRLTPEPASPSPSIPASPDIRDEEMLFAACTEEVYLGPPLCYSLALNRKPRLFSQTENPQPSLAFDGLPYFSCSDGNPECPSYLSVRDSTPDMQTESPYIPTGELSPLPRGENSDFCDAAGESAAGVSAARQGRSGNEGPPYLNPCARVGLIDSPAAAKCLADTKALESNMDPVMTKISVCGSATNPSKEPAAANPKINRQPMREADREDEERQGVAETLGEEERKRKGRSSSEGKSAAAAKQVSSADRHPIRVSSGRGQASLRPPTSKPGNAKRVPIIGATRVQL